MIFSGSIKGFQHNLHKKIERLAEGLPKAQTPKISLVTEAKESNVRLGMRRSDSELS